MEATSTQNKSKRRYPVWLYLINMLGLMSFLGWLIFYTGWFLYIAEDVPYDYGLLMVGADQFCFRPDVFEYSGVFLYPAPFYTTFCGLFAQVPQVLLWGWMLVPFVMLVWLTGQRGVAVFYPPFYIHTFLGQSTFLLLPIFWLARTASERASVQWWYGVLLPLALFKPHIAALPLVWLLWLGRRNGRFLLMSALSMLLLVAPAFWLRPTWVQDWLAAGRGFKLGSIANINIIPLRLLQLGEDQTPLVGDTLGLLLVLAFGGLITVILLWVLWKRRGHLELYDWVLVYAFTNPFIHDYDLIILLPFIGHRPKRLLIAMMGGWLAWFAAQITLDWKATITITVLLLAARLLRTDDAFDPAQPPLTW